MTARILKFPANRREPQAPTFSDPRLQRLAQLFATAIDKKTGKPIGVQAGVESTRKLMELIEARRGKGAS